MKNPARPVAPTIVRVSISFQNYVSIFSISFSFFFFQSNFDMTEKQKNFVPVHYRDFIDYLEMKTQPQTEKYIATQEDFMKDRGRN